ncbi:MAG: hypothetical protein DME75_09150 [Verrucomicrobia bacterium]|nr:MAG: hypothetical protein DME75_09150 [Verrucomicrobiota bacterium]
MFARLDSWALGIAIGAWSGLIVFSATAIPLLKDGPTGGPTLVLLSQYFIGYSVTWSGSFVGLLYGFIFGFCIGWLIAFLRNLVVSAYVHAVKFKVAMSSMDDYLDKP